MNRHVRRTVLAQLRGRLAPAEIDRLDAMVRDLTPPALAEEICRRREALQHPAVHLPAARSHEQH